jgi:SAM-dependent methyltransferase
MMYFDKLKIWDKFEQYRILHIAPEQKLSLKISALNKVEYIKGDINPSDETILKINVTAIPFDDGHFDSVICNHVLEHIQDYHKALKEIHRVLKSGGFAILQTPFSKLLSTNFEDRNINSTAQRLFFFGEVDHLRVFSGKQFFEEIEQAGFQLNIIKHSDLFDEKFSMYFGVNPEEDLIMASKIFLEEIPI